MARTRNDDCGERWREQILDGVGILSNTGAVPGGIVVWGDRGRAVMTSGGGSVLIAAAELGKGRVVTVAHDGLLTPSEESVRKLSTNIRTWLKRGVGGIAEETLSEKNKPESLQEGSMMMWNGAVGLQLPEDAICEHIINGGSLLHAMCPWGWLQLNPGKTLRDMPLSKTLEMAGMAYTDDYGDIPQAGLNVAEHRATEGNHTLHSLRYIVRNPDEFLEGRGEVPALNLSAIPEEVRQQVVGPELRLFIVNFKCAKCEERGSLAKLCPKPARPLKSPGQRALCDILETAERMRLLDGCLPGVDIFPGSFDCMPPCVRREVEMKSSLHDVHPTGYYLPAGGTLILRVLTEPLPAGWTLNVGSHSDSLSDAKELRRWPKIDEVAVIKNSQISVHAPFGGLIYLESPQEPSSIMISLENVVEAPIFVLNEPRSVQKWQTRRHSPGLWADIVGENIMLTLPAESVREVDDPSAAIRGWDKVVRAHNELRGTNPAHARKQWVVTDEQPSVGYMHSGYPIVTHLDVAQPDHELFLLDEEVLASRGNWGLYHEIGHNMQRTAWTFEGTGEVTCNIFTLHAMETVSGQAVWIHDWLQDQRENAETYLRSNAAFSAWQKDPGCALFIYAQIARVFGWEPYKRVFRRYEEHMEAWRLNNLQSKIDTWVLEISRACGYNLVPLFDLWKIPVSPAIDPQLSGLTCFLPDDELTQSCPEAVARVLDKYRGCCRSLQ